MKKGVREEMRRVISLCSLGAVLLFLSMAYFFTTKNTIQQSFWSLVPSFIAISLALVTKEIYSSLFLGILSGALFYTGYNPEKTIRHVFTEGIFEVLSNPENVAILCFLVILGMMVQLMRKTGGSRAFGNWAQTRIKSRKASMFATVVLGLLIFSDDYFNCLTVGSVMLPVTDKARISRAKLAYLIDTSAAPICIIAPISSFVAAFSGFVKGENGMKLFLQTIPYNFYALLSLCMMIFLIFLDVDFGPMAEHEKNAREKGDLFTTKERPYGEEKQEKEVEGKISDMLFPSIALIVSCTVAMMYFGGFFSGADVITAFTQSDALSGLVFGSFLALVFTLIFYYFHSSISFHDAMECLPEGFKQMVPAILILSFAWTLKEMTDSLGAKEFVETVVAGGAQGMLFLLPAFIFVIAVGLSFATGSSWGTFGILIPIVQAIFRKTDYTMMIIAMSACMAGAVCGDHCSPVSDTTIMSSAAAGCMHLNHVTTQFPYAMLVAAISLMAYCLAGFLKSPWVSLGVSVFILFSLLMEVKRRKSPKKAVRKK